MATLASHRPNPQPPIEVRCAGCSETLEVEPGLTEFICPDCHTPQALPPELMPRKRKALPLPRGVDSSKMQLPCGSCAALLNVPHGLARFSCPRCGVELAVDQERLKGYLAGSSVAVDDVAFVMPSAVRLPLGVDAEPPIQNYVTTLIAPRAASIDLDHQSFVTTPRVPCVSSTDSEIQDVIPVSSRGLVSSSINTNYKNIPTTIPASVTPVPCRLNSQQTEEEEETAEEREETVPTPPPTKKAVSKVNPKQNKKQSAGPTTKELELSLRRSKRVAQSSPPTKKKQKSQQSQPIQSRPSHNQPSQSQPSEDNEIPLDIARHYNDLFPLDNDPLWNPISPTPDPGSQIQDPNPPILDPVSEIPDLNPQDGEMNSDDNEGRDEAYVPETDSSQSEPEPDSTHEPEPDSTHEPEPDSTHEPESVMKKALMDAQKRRGLNPGKPKKRRKITPGKRGPSTRCLEIWDRPDDDPIEIEFNNVGQPIGETAYALSNFLGSISRDGKLVPINYTDWRAIPVKFKDVVWYIVKDWLEEDPIEIEFNNMGLPIGEIACALSNFLGTISRDGNLVPLNYMNWRAISVKFKDIVWYIVKSKFKMQEDNRRYVMAAVGRNWNSWKARLKKNHYDVHDNDEARLADIDKRIEPEQWPFLVNFWSSDEGKKRSETNRACAAKQKTYHAMGRKSFARIREEERLKRENKEEPCRAEMFILTHTRKDGTPIDEESAQIIARLREELAKAETSSSPASSKALKNDILAKVLGKEKHIRTYGLLPTRPDNWGGPRDSEERARVVREAERLAEEKAKPMKEQMEAMERRHKEMEMEMQVMRQAMLAMSGMAPPGFGGSVQGGGDGECGASDHDGLSNR